jgi:hypothetical protein
MLCKTGLSQTCVHKKAKLRCCKLTHFSMLCKAETSPTCDPQKTIRFVARMIPIQKDFDQHEIPIDPSSECALRLPRHKDGQRTYLRRRTRRLGQGQATYHAFKLRSCSSRCGRVVRVTHGRERKPNTRKSRELSQTASLLLRGQCLQ